MTRTVDVSIRKVIGAVVIIVGKRLSPVYSGVSLGWGCFKNSSLEQVAVESALTGGMMVARLVFECRGILTKRLYCPELKVRFRWLRITQVSSERG